MAYDASRGVNVLFGGYTNGDVRNGQTWEWNGSAWTLRSSSEPPRAGHAMAYDASRGVTVLFGGGTNSGVSSETWEWNGSAWTLRSSSGPSPRYGLAMAYDAGRGVTMLFGGRAADLAPLGDTWAYGLAAESSGTLSGLVTHAVTGQALVGVQVSVTGRLTTTGADGRYQLAYIPPGLYTAAFNASGFNPESVQVTIAAGATTTRNFALWPQVVGTSPAVISVRSQYVDPQQSTKTYFLDGVSLSQTFTATVDWHGHTASKVRWITPQGTFDTPTSGTTASRAFNMGTDFGPGGTLTAQAIATDGTQSAPVQAKMKVAPYPPGMALLSPGTGGNMLRYSTPTITSGQGTEISAGTPYGSIPGDFPLFGNEAFKFAALFDAKAEFSGDGRGTAALRHVLQTGGLGPMDVAGLTFNTTVSGAATWQFVESPDQWTYGGQILFGQQINAKVPPIPFYFPFGICPVCVPAYFRGQIRGNWNVGLGFTTWTAPGQPVLNGLLQWDPILYAEANLGIGLADFVALESYLGGGARMKIRYPEAPNLQQLQLYLAGGPGSCF